MGCPTPAEYAERAARAEAAPLFASLEAIPMTLFTDIDWLRDERDDSVEVDGMLTYLEADGTEAVAEIEVRTRGNFRRDKRNCNFPPLRLDFRTGRMEGTLFEGQDKLKLVTPCHDGRDSYQNYIFDEYLAYRMFQVDDPVAFRVRLVEITYEDIEDDYDTRTKIGFLIEDEDAMAERNRSTLEEEPQFHPARTDADHSVTGGHVQLHDRQQRTGRSSTSTTRRWSAPRRDTSTCRCRTTSTSRASVNARYASVGPAPVDPQRDVSGIYRGFCRPELQYDPAVSVFAEARAEIEKLYTDFAALGYEEFDDDDAEDAIDYFEDFWKVIDDPEEFEDEIVDECRSRARLSSGGRAGTLRNQRRVEAGLAEMVGLVRGVIADGTVSSGEAARLTEWTRENPDVAVRYPANVLARRLERIFQDGRVDAEERARLAAMLEQLAANPAGLAGGFRLATDLPAHDPAPEHRLRRTEPSSSEGRWRTARPTRASERSPTVAAPVSEG